MTTAIEKLVARYVRDVTPFRTTSGRGPEQVESGVELLALDAEGRREAVIAAYQALPTNHTNAYGRKIMLGRLATALLRARLPLLDADFVVMTEHAARAVPPAWGPCDYDHALVKAMARLETPPSPKLKRALKALMARRGTKHAIDRRICAACTKLIEM